MCASCTDRERTATASADAAASAAPSASSARSAPSSTPLPLPSPLSSALLPIDGPAIAPSPPSEWTWKTYRGDKFTVLFPGEPKLRVLPAEDDRVGFTEAHLDVPGGQVSFSAGYTEHTKDEVAKPDVFLDARANAPRRGITDVLTKRAISLPSGQPGRVVILRRQISGPPLRVYSRLYLVGVRLYSLIVSTLDEGGVSEDVVKRFMDSFKLL